jgi:LysM repeat protein
MKLKIPFANSRQLAGSTISLVLLVTLLTVALPQTALAAPAQYICSTKHAVTSGETVRTIASYYGVKWQDLADANKLDYPYELRVGQKLCIPITNTSGSGKNSNMNISIYGGRVNIEGSYFPKNSVFIVRVRESRSNSWYKIGKATSNSDGKVKDTRSLPSALRNSSSIYVCLKNALTGEVYCRSVSNATWKY